jgi:hypothetical protein
MINKVPDYNTNNFDINDLYRLMFGYVALPYPALGTRLANNIPFIRKGEDVNNQRISVDDGLLLGTYELSKIGTPIRMPFRLAGIMLPNEPIVEISGGKSIVSTELAGGAGAIKENMGLNDWQISIKGIVVSDEPDTYPEKEMREILEIINKQTSLKCENDLMRIFKINQLVIKDYRFPATEGAIEWQAYTLECLSDTDRELDFFDPSRA